MQFEAGNIYHIYNQGNNRQKIFFERENYLFFLKKIKTHVVPYADILAWCLMPNHFHLMAYVHNKDERCQSGRDFESHSNQIIHPMTDIINKEENKDVNTINKESHRMNYKTLNDS